MKKDFRLYKVRKFGEKVSITFDFLTNHWRLWFQCSLYLLLPLCLLQAVALNGLFGGVMNSTIINDGDEGLLAIGISYIGYIVFACTGMLLLSSFTYAMIRHYHENGDTLEGVTFRDLVPRIKKNAWRGFVVGLRLVTIVVLCFVLIGFLSAWSVGAVAFIVFLAMIAAFVFCVPLSLALPLCMFEDDLGAFSVLRRAFRLGWNVWGGILLLMIVVGMIGSIVQGATATPWYILTMVRMLLTSEEKGVGVVDAPWYSFVTFLLAAIQAFGSYIAMSFMVTALGYQYGNAAEQMDAMSVDEGIDNFEKLADNDELDNFENLV